MRAVFVGALLGGLAALASPRALADEGAAAAPVPPPIHIEDVSGARGQWHQGSTIVAAPVEEVRAWLLDFAGWPRRFPDVVATRVLKHTTPNVWILWYHSRILARDVTIRVHATPDQVTYRGAPGEKRAPAGQILVKAIDRQHTLVTMKTRSLGLPRSAAARSQTERTRRKLEADLTALHALAGQKL
jgi:hypothetical protein